MKLLGLFLLVALVISAVGVPFIYVYYRNWDEASRGEFFFGVSFGLKTAQEAKSLIDRVKGYSNFFLVNSWDITINETALNEVCDYTVKANLSFMVFFDFVSREIYPWHQTWLDTAQERWGDSFLGVYLYDEPGGRQLDVGKDEPDKRVKNASDYSEAAKVYVDSLSFQYSTLDVKMRSIPMFTSDYALYWFDYLAGYDAVFVELGWNHSIPQHIGLGRGAANSQGKDWGAIITWTYDKPPYLANGSKIFLDMLTSYRAGAKYVIVLNSDFSPFDSNSSELSQISSESHEILRDEHFLAMERFWTYINSYPKDVCSRVGGEVAFVLPKDYGWGMRNPDDNIWGLWPADDQSSLIWENLNKLITKYGLRLDIIYDDSMFNYNEKYFKVFLWNSTII